MYVAGITGKIWLTFCKYYQTMQSAVSWNQGLSNTFKISQGVWQGGVVSPLLYIIYIDELTKHLHQARLDVVVNGNYSGVLAFADDVCLIAESSQELQAMLDIHVAAKYASDWEYNANKSVYMTFSNQDTQTPTEEELLLGNNPVENQQEHTYLGITFRARNQLRNEDVTNKSMLA